MLDAGVQALKAAVHGCAMGGASPAGHNALGWARQPNSACCHSAPGKSSLVASLPATTVLTLVDAKHITQHLDEVKPDGVVNEAVQQVPPVIAALSGRHPLAWSASGLLRPLQLGWVGHAAASPATLNGWLCRWLLPTRSC